MSDEQTAIESPEDTLLNAVLGPDTQDLDERATKLDNPQDIDELDEGDEQRADDEAEGKPKVEEPAEPEEDYIEIAGEDGAEPTRLRVADLVEKARQYDSIEGQKAQIIERVEREATEAATSRLKTIEQAGTQTAYMIQAALQVVQPPQRPQPPNPALMNQDYTRWEQENAAYQQANFAYEQNQQRYEYAKHLGQQLMQQAEAATAQAREQRDAAELQRLQRAWPEFGQAETLDKFVGDMGREFGFSPQELDEILVDHRQALVARDALAYRAMKAQSGQVKAKVEAKAPKLVRSKQEAKGSGANRDTKGRYVSDALGALKKTNSDDAAAAYFTGLVKSGRI